MAERYQRLFALPEKNLYTSGAPVLIADGALLLDTLTNGVIAQLKLQNICAKAVKAVKVAVTPLDSVNRPLGEPVPYEYLDLKAERDSCFGQDRPIRLPDAAARAYSAAVTEVAFADNEIWTADDSAVWEPIPAQKTLEEALGDAELAKQYAIRFGGDCSCEPLRHADLWQCACGAVNRSEEEACHTCAKAAEPLFSCDLQTLAEEKDVRLAEEQAAREAKEAADREAKEAAAKKLKKNLSIGIPALVALIAVLLLMTQVIIPNGKYKHAVEMMEAGDYSAAMDAFLALDGYKDSEQMVLAVMEHFMPLQTISGGGNHSVALQEDGTIATAGDDDYEQCDTYDWVDIVSVEAGGIHTLGLKSDGTVVAVGSNDAYQCDVAGCENAVAIAAGSHHSVVLFANGTVVATGSSNYGACDVGDWTDIIAIAAGPNLTLGLKSDGTVVSAGYDNDGDIDVSGWKDVVAIAAGDQHAVALKADGTVLATGRNEEKQCKVSAWKDIVAISAGAYFTVGLKADGTVVATGYNEDGECSVAAWKDIVAIDTGFYHTLGLKKDGTVLSTGYNEDDRCDVSGWENIRVPNEK